MKKFWMVFGMVAAVGVALTAHDLFARSSEASQVIAVEQARTAALESSDAAALDRIMADDVTYVHASGRVDTKSSYLAAIRSGQLHYISWEPKKLQVRVMKDSAVINGEYSVRVRDSRVQPAPFDIDIFILTVYARRAGHWQQIAWQSTRDVATSPAH